VSTAFFCRDKEDDEQDTSRFVLGPWINNDDAEGGSALPPPPLQEQKPPESGDGRGPRSNSGEEGDRPPWRRCVRVRMHACARVHVCDFLVVLVAPFARRFELVFFLSQHAVLSQTVCLLQLIHYIMLPILFFVTTLCIFV
jgi:hypothetical protein